MGHGLRVLARLTDDLMVNPNLDLGSREHGSPVHGSRISRNHFGEILR